eukprot:gene40415-49981_t
MACMAEGDWDMVKLPDGAMLQITALLNGQDNAIPINDIIVALLEDLFVTVHPEAGHETIAQATIIERVEELRDNMKHQDQQSASLSTDRCRGFDPRFTQ